MTRQESPFDRVRTSLAADPSTEFGAPGARIEVLRTIDGPFSSVQHVRVSAPGRVTQAYIKILKPRSPTEDDVVRARRGLEREYQLTRACWEALGQDTGLGAVRPIALVPELCAMVTEEVPGRPFGELLVDPAPNAAALSRVAANIGRWVRAYQATASQTAIVELSERRTYVDQRLRQLEGRVFSGAERRHLLERFDALAATLGASVRAVPIHADLTPMNIVADSSSRVTVLDFTMAKSGTEHHDLAHVYFHLELMAVRNRRRRAMLHALQREMLAGYDPALTPGDPLFRLMLLQHSVCHVVLLAGRRVPVADLAYRWFLRRRWKNCEQLLAVA